MCSKNHAKMEIFINNQVKTKKKSENEKERLEVLQ